MKKTVLLVEDDTTLRMGLETALRREGYDLLSAACIEEARRHLNGASDRADSQNTAPPTGPDLLLLDLSLPDGLGFSLCAEAKRRSLPVIFVTVRDDERDITKGLDMGGDDYVTKPFRLPVLLSRIRAVLRRYAERPTPDLLRCGSVTLTPSQTRVRVADREIALTAGEYRLLLILLQNKNRTLTRGRLLERMWDENGSFVNDNTLTVTVKRLREKLGEDAARVLRTVRGIGYKAAEPDEE